jgi:hypothetical protein
MLLNGKKDNFQLRFYKYFEPFEYENSTAGL